MSQDYTISDLKTYMEDKLLNSSSDGLFEFSFQSDCRQAIDTLGYPLESGEGLLFSFAAIAGGWRTEVGRRLLDSGAEELGVGDDFEKIRRTDLARVDDAGYGGHSHRHANGAHPSRALNSLVDIDVNGNSITSMEALFTELSEADFDARSQFDVAFELFKDVKTFGGLSSFDYLDLAVRVNSQEWLTPDYLKVSHADRNGPGKTLRRTLANQGSDDGDLSENGQTILEELQDFAEYELGLSHTDAFFDVESCLCTYHGELENKGPDWRGACT